MGGWYGCTSGGRVSANSLGPFQPPTPLALSSDVTTRTQSAPVRSAAVPTSKHHILMRCATICGLACVATSMPAWCRCFITSCLSSVFRRDIYGLPLLFVYVGASLYIPLLARWVRVFPQPNPKQNWHVLKTCASVEVFQIFECAHQRPACRHQPRARD